jgi:mannose-6-phosphate isomerase-like protein (cupin superfamily)
MQEYEKGIVSKPWGYEYLMYQSDRIGVWFLYIAAGRKTSLHCHPAKKTGYILLSGEAEVSFLNDTTRLKAISKLMIREGLFHSTKALSPEGVSVIEVENPPDKTNLVRLDDAYGRKEEPYEGPDAVVPVTAECIKFTAPETDMPIVYQVAGVSMVIERRNDLAALRTRPSGEIILVLDGGLVSKNNDPILSSGDVVTISTFSYLADTFTAPQGMSFISFRREQNQDA